MRNIIGRIGFGKAVHLISAIGTAACGAKGGTASPVDGPFSKVTCKRCLKIEAGMIGLDEVEAYTLDAARVAPTAAPVAPTSRTGRRAARRAQARKLRATTAQTRSVARAARVKRNGTPAPARTLLVAAGLPDDIAKRYAPAFSKGVETVLPKTSTRVRTGAHRSKRVAVKVFTPAEFADRLAHYAPKNAEHARLFALAG